MENQPLFTFGVHWLKGILAPGRLIGDKLVVYPSKVIFRTGVFSKDERIVPVSKITDIRITKGCVAGVFGYGNIYVESAGTGGPEIIMQDIDNPDYARDLIVHLVEQTD